MIIRVRLSPKGFEKLLKVYDRIALSGVVASGKTLLLENAELGSRPVLHTDHLVGRKWAEIPSLISSEVEGKPEFIVAGTQVPRCLRKGLKVDCLLWLNEPRHFLSARQEAFGRGIRTIMHAWRRQNPEIPVYFSRKALHDSELERMPV